MKAIVLGAMFAGMLVAIPLAGAESATVTVTTDGYVECETAPTRVGTPWLRPRVGVATDDCDATVTYHGVLGLLVDCEHQGETVGPVAGLRLDADDCDAQATLLV